MDVDRDRLLALSEAAAEDGEPLRWFEELYSSANRDSEEIPWATMEPHPMLMSWLKGKNLSGKALVIGCGLGDDAVGLEQEGFDVTAFDLSESCIDWCKERFPNSQVNWMAADLLNLPKSFFSNFDLVVEIHILQAIPEEVREAAAPIIPKLLRKDGHLVCIGRLDDGSIPEIPPPPWPLKMSWLQTVFASLTKIDVEFFRKEESPETNRYRTVWKME